MTTTFKTMPHPAPWACLMRRVERLELGQPMWNPHWRASALLAGLWRAELRQDESGSALPMNTLFQYPLSLPPLIHRKKSSRKFYSSSKNFVGKPDLQYPTEELPPSLALLSTNHNLPNATEWAPITKPQGRLQSGGCRTYRIYLLSKHWPVECSLPSPDPPWAQSLRLHHRLKIPVCVWPHPQPRICRRVYGLFPRSSHLRVVREDYAHMSSAQDKACLWPLRTARRKWGAALPLTPCPSRHRFL